MDIIEVRHVSMRFRLASDKIQSLKEYTVAALTGRLKYKEFCVFRDLNFTVRKGEVVGIIGRNGAGKSTLLKIISGVLEPTEGEAVCHGNVVPMLELGSGFDFELSGRENIFLNGAILGYTEAFLKEKYQEIVDFSELGTFIEEPIRNYSSGMLMRLAFSIATAVKPEILIADEVLAVGDEAFQKKSKRKMLELMGGGTTVLFVSHSIDQILEICSRVLWIEEGEIKGYGDPKEICDAYQKVMDYDRLAQETKKEGMRNTDSYKFMLDVLIVYHEDGLSFYEALARKEQLLVGNVCAHILCIADMKQEIIAQNRMILFLNCGVSEAEKYIGSIERLHKACAAECGDLRQAAEWRKAFPQVLLLSSDPEIRKAGPGNGCRYVPVAVTERLLQVSERLRNEKEAVPREPARGIERDQGLLNDSKADPAGKCREEGGLRAAAVIGAGAGEAAGAADYNLCIIRADYPEDVLRDIGKTDYVFDMTGGEGSSWRRYLPLLCELAGSVYGGRIGSLNELPRRAEELPRRRTAADPEDGIAIAEAHSTMKSGIPFSRMVRQRFRPFAAFAVRRTDVIGKHPAIVRKLCESVGRGDDTVILADVAREEYLEAGGIRVPVIPKAVKYVLGSFDTVVALDPEEFNFLLSYPNIRERIYFVSEWGPDQYDVGDFRRIQASQSYLPCVPVTFWTDSGRIQTLLKDRYGQDAILIRAKTADKGEAGAEKN